jgi:hypothetical protein
MRANLVNDGLELLIFCKTALTGSIVIEVVLLVVAMLKEQKIIEGIQWTRGVIIVTGAASCGIAGLTGVMKGLSAYFLLHLLSSLILLIRMNCRPARFIPGASAATLAAATAKARKQASSSKQTREITLAAIKEVSSFSINNILQFILSGIPDNVLSFVLVWTAFYAFTNGAV